MASYMICQHDNAFICCESIYIRDFKIDVYGKRLTSDTLFGTLTVKSFTYTYRIYSKYRKLHTETLCLTVTIETCRLILNDFLRT